MHSTIIIAEAGVNHNGSLDTAKKMVKVAKACGADYIKFQTFVPELLVTAETEMAAYQKNNTKKTVSQLEMLNGLALNADQFAEIFDFCQKTGIGFLSAPFDHPSVELLKKFNMNHWKIASGEITNYPLLKRVAQVADSIILSTGMCVIEEIQAAINVIHENGDAKISLLHCTTDYPTAYNDVNLRALEILSEVFSLPVGYSDHTIGIEVSIAAVAKGAQIIEKHFTLDRNMDGPDHLASSEPQELKALIDSIRNIELAMGEKIKKPTAAEIENIKIARKSIVAKIEIDQGEEFSESNLCVKRPGTGISPMEWDRIIGMKSPKKFKKDEIIVI